MKKYMTLVVGLAVVGIVLFWYVIVHNALISAEANIAARWSQVQNVYQRRMDLVPNLVAAVKGYAAHEEQLLRDVAALRARAQQLAAPTLDDAEALAAFQQEQGEVGTIVTRLLAASDAHPEIKSSENFLALQAQLEGVENRIAVERKRYIDAVREYNAKIRRIPTTIVAALGGFKPKPEFAANPGAERAPDVRF